MHLNKIIIFTLLFYSCMQTTRQNNRILPKNYLHNVVNEKTLNKKDFINTKWRAIDYNNGKFRKMKIKEKWQSFIKINRTNAVIYLQEPTKYDLDSIQATKKSIILHIKNAKWIYKFKWIDKKHHIGRWDYIYNKIIIDSSFSMYVVNEKYIDSLSKK